MDIEKLVKQIMKETAANGEPVTEEEALEMAKMELNAKGIKNYAQSEKPRATTNRKQKIDEDKVDLIKRIKNGLFIYTNDSGGITNLKIVNPQKEITFSFGGFDYSVCLTKHRPPKE